MTDNPEAEPGVQDSIPEHFPAPVIELAYHMPEGIDVRCRHCRRVGKQPNHRHGYVVRSSNGKAILVGNKCGRDHYKDEWGLIEGQWKELKNRRDSLRRLRDLNNNWALVRAELNAFSSSPMWGIHDTLATNLREKLPRFYDFLVTMLTNCGGELHIMERIRDIRAEERRPENAPPKEIYRWQERPMGSIGGREFLTGNSSLRTSFNGVYEKLVVEVESLSKVGSNLNNDELAKRLRTVTGLFKQVSIAVKRVRSARAFVDPQHIELLCQCATDWRKHRQSSDTYRYDGRDIIAAERGAEPVKCPMQTFEIPETRRLKMYLS